MAAALLGATGETCPDDAAFVGAAERPEQMLRCIWLAAWAARKEGFDRCNHRNLAPLLVLFANRYKELAEASA